MLYSCNLAWSSFLVCSYAMIKNSSSFSYNVAQLRNSIVYTENSHPQKCENTHKNISFCRRPATSTGDYFSKYLTTKSKQIFMSFCCMFVLSLQCDITNKFNGAYVFKLLACCLYVLLLFFYSRCGFRFEQFVNNLM